MARPKSTGRSDLNNVVDLFANSQRARFESMSTFVRQLRSPRVKEQVGRDDHLFATILKLAFDDYGIKQTQLMNRLDLSAGVLSRWSNKINLPASLMRPPVVEAIADVIEEEIERQQASSSDVLFGRVLN